jgi:hypothetical protein
MNGQQARAWAAPIWSHERAIRDGLRLASVVVSIGILVFAWRQPPEGAFDTFAYYTAHLPDPYRVSTEGQAGAFLYAPPIAQLLEPLRALPWAVFHTLWIGISLAALWYLVGPVLLVPTLVLWPFTLIDIGFGNLNLWLAAAVVLGFRHPAAWALVLLTKVTPGVGLLWFAVRREWRALGVALGATAAIAAVSFLLAPSLWADWVHVLADHAAFAPVDPQPPLWMRLPAAALIVAWGARTDRPWTVPFGAALALPVLSAVSLSMFVGVIGVLRRTGWRFGPVPTAMSCLSRGFGPGDPSTRHGDRAQLMSGGRVMRAADRRRPALHRPPNCRGPKYEQEGDARVEPEVGAAMRLEASDQTSAVVRSDGGRRR